MDRENEVSKRYVLIDYPWSLLYYTHVAFLDIGILIVNERAERRMSDKLLI